MDILSHEPLNVIIILPYILDFAIGLLLFTRRHRVAFLRVLCAANPRFETGVSKAAAFAASVHHSQAFHNGLRLPWANRLSFPLPQ